MLLTQNLESNDYRVRRNFLSGFDRTGRLIPNFLEKSFSVMMLLFG